ncbi:MAG TPA: ATP-binding protein, partial [Candidatus Methylacidiphilales bacterium]|nr:ATP-binding protein [Candidatus Methylacidiphilales bacterium]
MSDKILDTPTASATPSKAAAALPTVPPPSRPSSATPPATLSPGAVATIAAGGPGAGNLPGATPTVSPVSNRIPLRLQTKRWLTLILPIWLIITVVGYWMWEFYTNAIMEKTTEGITEMLKLEVELAVRSVQNLASDLLVIADSNELPLMEGTPEQQALAIESLKRDFVSLGTHKRFYDQLRFIDERGMERVRVNFERTLPDIVPDDKLQSKATRYFVKETMKLKPGEIYVSPLDLSIEWGKIELVDGAYKPMIRFCVPVFQNSEKSKPNPKPYGMLTLSYLPEHTMLQEIRRLSGPSPGDLMMLNKDSYWLVGPEKESEWGFMWEQLKAVNIPRKNINFKQLYPEAWAQIEAAPHGNFHTSQGYFVFDTVSPLDALKKFNPDLKYESYNWKFVNYIDNRELDKILAPRMLVVYTGGFAMLATAIVGWFMARSRIQREIAEASLKEEQKASEKLAMVASRTDNAVVILDSNKKIDWVNDGFTRMSGYSLNEVKGLSVGDILQGPESSRSGIIEIVAELEKAVPLQAEILLHTKEGFPLWIFMDGQPAYDENGNFSNYIIVNADVTSQKLAEEEALLARQTAEAANQAKSEFLANMSHELRTPMNAILGFSDLLGGMVTEGKQKSYLQAIASSGRSLLTLINDILDLSKIEAGKLEFQYEPSSLRQLLTEIKHIFSAKASEKSLYLNIDIQDDAPSGLLLDEVRVRQILFNVIGNALKFTDKGGITISARTTYKEDDETKVDLLLEVADTGIGIPTDQVDRIFQAFTQVSGQSTRKYGGTGLGLTITRRLTEMMGGKISVRSRHGEGSTFSFFFPNVTVTAFQDTSRADAQASRVDQFKPATILVADDVDLNRLLIAGYFEGSAHKLLMAQNGLEAVAQAKEHKPHVILMDVRMPEMDGVQASIIIRADPDTKHIPIIAVTASVLKHQEDEVREVVDGFLAKPVSKKDLVDMMRKYLPLQEIDPVAEAAADSEAEKTKELELKEGAGDPELWKVLLEQLRDAEKNQLPGLIQDQKMGEIEEFSQQLTGWAEDYKAPNLGQYASNLLEQVQMFDLDAMAQTLEKFPEQVALVAKFLGESEDAAAAIESKPASTKEVASTPPDSSASAASADHKPASVPKSVASASPRFAPAEPPRPPTATSEESKAKPEPASVAGDANAEKPSAATPAGTAPSASPSPNAAEWAGLIYQLRNHQADLWPGLVKSQMLGEIETFGNMLKDLGNDFHAQELVTYGKLLVSQAEEFDLDTLPATLDQYPVLIDKLAAEYTAATDKTPPTPTTTPPLSEATVTA